MAPKTRGKKVEEESMEDQSGPQLGEQNSLEVDSSNRENNETKLLTIEETEFDDNYIADGFTKHEIELGTQAREIADLKTDKEKLESELEKMRLKMNNQEETFQEQMEEMRNMFNKRNEVSNIGESNNGNVLDKLISKIAGAPKIQHLTEINKEKVELFLCEFRASKRANENIFIQDYILGDAKNILKANVPLLDEESVLIELEDYLDRLNKYKGNKLRTMLKSNLKWPITKTATLEEKTEIFFNTLNGIISELGIVGEKYKLVKKDVAYIVISKLPNELLIRKDDIKDDPELQNLNKLKELVISKCDTMRRIIQETAPLRKNKINRIFETAEENSEKDLNTEIPNWVNRIQQNHNQQLIMQRNANNAQKATNNYIRNNNSNRNNLVCDNCQVAGHAWQFCYKPLDMEKIRMKTKERFIQRRNNFNRTNMNFQRNRVFQNNPGYLQRQFGNNQRIEKIQVLKENVENCKKINLEIFDANTSKYIPVQGLLDSGTRLNVAPISLLKYKIRDEPMTREVLFKVPTGQTVKATQAAYLKLQLKYNGGILDLGNCKCFFIPNFNELLIGDLTMRHFNISPLNAVENVLKQNQ